MMMLVIMLREICHESLLRKTNAAVQEGIVEWLGGSIILFIVAYYRWKQTGCTWKQQGKYQRLG